MSGQPQPRQQRRHAPILQAVIAQRHLKFLPHRLGKEQQIRLLREIAEATAARGQIPAGDLLLPQPQAPFLQGQRADDRLEQRRLPRPVGTDQHEELPFPQSERHPLQNRPSVIGRPQRLQTQQRRRLRGTELCRRGRRERGRRASLREPRPRLRHAQRRGRPSQRRAQCHDRRRRGQPCRRGVRLRPPERPIPRQKEHFRRQRQHPLQAMLGQHNRHPLRVQLLQKREQFPGPLRIELAQRLIQQQDGWLQRERRRQRHPLPFAAGELRQGTLSQVRRAHTGQCRLHPRRERPRLAAVFQRERHLILHPIRHKTRLRILDDETDLSRHHARAGAQRVYLADEHPSADASASRLRHQAVDAAQQRALPHPGRAGHQHKRARLDSAVDLAQQRGRHLRIGEGDALEENSRGQPHPGREGCRGGVRRVSAPHAIRPREGRQSQQQQREPGPGGKRRRGRTRVHLIGKRLRREEQQSTPQRQRRERPAQHQPRSVGETGSRKRRGPVPAATDAPHPPRDRRDARRHQRAADPGGPLQQGAAASRQQQEQRHNERRRRAPGAPSPPGGETARLHRLCQLQGAFQRGDQQWQQQRQQIAQALHAMAAHRLRLPDLLQRLPTLRQKRQRHREHQSRLVKRGRGQAHEIARREA
ncbi:MAG: hypothetical protein BWY25_01265 [Chloroflexi bacterium ADurb.Bin222]|nr:MAG: hypothetical protein BWY25_01265 [Chloroflexi bacterium ADurb.Bin222]